MKQEQTQMEVSLITTRPGILRAIRLEAVLPRFVRRKFLASFFFSWLFLFFLWLASLFVGSIFLTESGAGFLRVLFGGVMLIVSAPLWFFIIAEFYFLATSRSERLLQTLTPDGARFFDVTYEAARRLWHIDAFRKTEVDIMRLYHTLPGDFFMQEVFLRLGIDRVAAGDFLKTKNQEFFVSRDVLFQTLASEAKEAKSDSITASELALLLFELDKDFKEFLFQYEIQKQDLRGAAHWVSAFMQMKQTRLRWWERGVLGRLPTFGASLMFGYTYTLDRFARDIHAGNQGALIPEGAVHEKELQEVANILARSDQANVILVGDPGSGKTAILEQLVRLILEGSAPPALWQKRLIAVDSVALTAATKQKGELEELMIKVMNEAARAGNVVLVLERFPEFIESAARMGVNAVSILEPYLEGTALQVIALSDKDQYHRVLEPHAIVTKLFERVEIAEPEITNMIFVLEEVAYELEKNHRVFITYPAIGEAVRLADRYIADGAMPEKAIDVLERAVTEAVGAGEIFVSKQHVQRAVEERTHIPVEKASGEEAEKLLKLEEVLHRRVIGQHAAITAVANVLRRARTGLHAGKRPMGSFLFLGPTGVGKTETAKALAQIYFGAEDAMMRFDMSEFQGPEGVNKLIGSFETSTPGVLSNAFRSKPFSLFLFDEFEKSSQDVVNLFLQILEEGFFADAHGKRVSARDAIIIATSNAGSNFIWEMVQQGKDPATMQKEVVDIIRQQGIFTPEILNRFDAIVVFEPLDKEKLHEVAKLLLEELASNLKKQEVELIISEELISKVVEMGYDPVMGARPMRRAIADKVEQIIARKLLDGSLQRGGTIQFTPEEIDKL